MHSLIRALWEWYSIPLIKNKNVNTRYFGFQLPILMVFMLTYCIHDGYQFELHFLHIFVELKYISLIFTIQFTVACLSNKNINFGDIFAVLTIRLVKLIYRKVIIFIIMDSLHIRLPHPFQ